MSIPKIAISNEDDSSLQILETHLSRMNTSYTPPSPFKSIIKNRSSLPQTPSSTSTTQSYYTCPTRLDSHLANDVIQNLLINNKPTDQLQIKKQVIDENDTENDVSELSQTELTPKTATTSLTDSKIPKRRGTISTSSLRHSNKNPLETLHKRHFSLRKNRSFTNENNENSSTIILNKSAQNNFIPHVSSPPPPLPYAEKDVRNSLTQIAHEQRQRKPNPIRRTNSYRSPSSSTTTSRCFVVRDGKLVEQEINHSRSATKRRSTLDYSSYPLAQVETSSIYETPKHEVNEQYIQSMENNSIRLVTDTNLNAQSTVNDQSDMQLSVTKENQEPSGVSLEGGSNKTYFTKNNDISK